MEMLQAFISNIPSLGFIGLAIYLGLYHSDRSPTIPFIICLSCCFVMTGIFSWVKASALDYAEHHQYGYDGKNMTRNIYKTFFVLRILLSIVALIYLAIGIYLLTT